MSNENSHGTPLPTPTNVAQHPSSSLVDLKHLRYLPSHWQVPSFELVLVLGHPAYLTISNSRQRKQSLTTRVTTPFSVISQRHVRRMSYTASLDGRSTYCIISARSTNALSTMDEKSINQFKISQITNQLLWQGCWLPSPERFYDAWVCQVGSIKHLPPIPFQHGNERAKHQPTRKPSEGSVPAKAPARAAVKDSTSSADDLRMSYHFISR